MFQNHAPFVISKIAAKAQIWQRMPREDLIKVCRKQDLVHRLISLSLLFNI